MTMMEKQIVAGGNYGVSEVCLTSFDNLPQTDVRPFPTLDPDLAGHPRFKTIQELHGAILVQLQDVVKLFQVALLHTVTNMPINPH